MRNSILLYSMLLTSAGLFSQESVNSGGGEATGSGEVSYSIGQIGYTVLSSVNDDALLYQGVQIPYEVFSANLDCILYDTAPTDLTKSFDPVNGVKDRIQLKWYKASPEIRYSDEDAAMCDIKFWKKRFLDPETGNPIGPNIENPDSTLLNNVKKTYPDNSPREIFKWPVKYRADGVNNAKRVEPNFRYEWQVRCECGHGGDGPESPWSVTRIFNTKDFDPVTGIYTPPAGEESQNLSKRQEQKEMSAQLYPNPSDGTFMIRFETEERITNVQLKLRDIQGKLIQQEIHSMKKSSGEILWSSQVDLEKGIYLMEIITDENRYTKRVMIN